MPTHPVIPPIVLSWLRLKADQELREAAGHEDNIYRERCLAKADAYGEVIENLEGLR